jgi:hypothetical protein
MNDANEKRGARFEMAALSVIWYADEDGGRAISV